MKQYDEVVKNRYDNLDFSSKGMLSNMYSLLNPVGYYGAIHSIEILKDFVALLADRFDPDEVHILDAGCGNGFCTRIMAELLGTGERVYGFDYSQNEVDFCEAMNPTINYSHADICDFSYELSMEGITAFDCFMHLRREEEIVKAMSNIYNALRNDGLFLWYDCNADTHFAEDENDERGFSVAEMDKYATDAGFRLIKSRSLYKRVPFYNTSTYYFAGKIGMLPLMLLDRFMPTKQTINVRVYKK